MDNKDYENHTVNPIQDRPDLFYKIENKVDLFLDTKEHKSEYNNEEINKFKNFAVACYVPFICLYFILTGNYKNSNYLKFHVNEGLDVTITLIVVMVVTKILKSLFTGNSLIINNTPWWVDAIVAILYFGVILLMLFGIINTVNNSSKELPVIGKIKLIK